MAPLIYFLIALLCTISFIGFYSPRIFQKNTLHPHSVYYRKQVMPILTAGFMDSSWMHLLVNVTLVYLIGMRIERIEGVSGLWVLAVFMAGVIVGNVSSTLVRRNDFQFTSVEASGGVVSLLTAAAYLNFSTTYFNLPVLENITGMHISFYLSLATFLAVKIRKRDEYDHYCYSLLCFS